MTEPTTAHPLRALLCRLLSGACNANNKELLALREENETLREENAKLRADVLVLCAQNPIAGSLDLKTYGELHAAVLSTMAPRKSSALLDAARADQLQGIKGMVDEAEFDGLVEKLMQDEALYADQHRAERALTSPRPKLVTWLAQASILLSDAHELLIGVQIDRKLLQEDPEVCAGYLSSIAEKAFEIQHIADPMAAILVPVQNDDLVTEMDFQSDQPSSASQQDHGDSWEHMQAIAQGVSAEREAFEALAGEQDPSPSDDDEWSSLAEDEEPITDAEIADTLGALFDAADEIRAERLASEAQAVPADDDLTPDTEEAAAASATDTGDTIEQGEAQPSVTAGWSERSVYGVTVLGAPQDRAWSNWLSGNDLTRAELCRLLKEEGLESRVATETVSRMLQHSRAKATVGKRKNDHAYHLLKKAG